MSRRDWTRVLGLVPVAGLAWWLIGFAPWIATGLNGRSELGPDAGTGLAGTPLALPFANASFSLLAACSLVGGLVAGLAGLLVADVRIWPSLASLCGVAVAFVLAAAQSANSIRAAAPGTFASEDLVLNGLATAAAAVTALGWLIGTVSVLGRPVLGIALAVLAGAVPAWVWSLVAALTPGPALSGSPLIYWLGAAALATALVVIGARPPVRILAWPVAVVFAWLVGPALTAAGYLEQLVRPAAIRPEGLLDALGAAWRVFTLAVLPESRPLLIVWFGAVAGAAVVTAVTARRSRTATKVEGAAGGPLV